MARGKVICGSDMDCGGQTPMHYSTPQKARSSGGQEEIRRRMKKHWFISPKTERVRVILRTWTKQC